MTHCRAGVRWLTHLHEAAREAGSAGEAPGWAAEACAHPTVETWFHALVRANFRGTLKARHPRRPGLLFFRRPSRVGGALPAA